MSTCYCLHCRNDWMTVLYPLFISCWSIKHLLSIVQEYSIAYFNTHPFSIPILNFFILLYILCTLEKITTLLHISYGCLLHICFSWHPWLISWPLQPITWNRSIIMLFMSVMMCLDVASEPLSMTQRSWGSVPTLTALYRSCHMPYEIVHIIHSLYVSFPLPLSLWTPPLVF